MVLVSSVFSLGVCQARAMFYSVIPNLKDQLVLCWILSFVKVVISLGADHMISDGLVCRDLDIVINKFLSKYDLHGAT